jgi:hypothetical protein
MPPSSSLLASVAVLCAGVFVANVAYGWYCQDHYVPALTLSRALDAGDGCTVTIGDSRMAAGVDRAVLGETVTKTSEEQCVAALGVGALGISGQKMVLGRYLASRKPRTVVLGVSTGGLLPAPAPHPSELVGNRALELGWSTTSDWFAYYRGELPERFDDTIRFGFNRLSALSSYASLTWFKAQRLQDRLAGTATSGPANRFGTLEDMQALAAHFSAADRASLERADGHFTTSVWFDRIRELTAGAGARLVVVHVPMHSSYRSGIIGTPAARRYDEWATRELAARGAQYVDFSSLVPDERFSDGLHLDPEGARTFSRAVGRALAGTSLSASVEK